MGGHVGRVAVAGDIQRIRPGCNVTAVGIGRGRPPLHKLDQFGPQLFRAEARNSCTVHGGEQALHDAAIDGAIRHRDPEIAAAGGFMGIAQKRCVHAGLQIEIIAAVKRPIGSAVASAPIECRVCG